MAEAHLHDTIEKYLLGELSAQARERFEADMATDPALREQVELQRLGLMGLQGLAAANLRKKFDQWDEDMDAPMPPTASPTFLPNSKFWIWTTATLFLLLTAGAFWHFSQMSKIQQKPAQKELQTILHDSIIMALRTSFQQKSDSLLALTRLPISAKDSISMLEIKRLREEIDRKDKMLRDLESRRRAGNPQIAMQFAPLYNTKIRGGNTDEDATLAKAKKAYDTGDFATSARLLKSIPANDPRYAEVKQRLPYSLFYNKDFEGAIPGFVDLLEADNYGDPELPWYLALCYVGNGQNMEARILLQVILQNPKHKYYQKATDLKKALDIR